MTKHRVFFIELKFFSKRKKSFTAGRNGECQLGCDKGLGIETFHRDLLLFIRIQDCQCLRMLLVQNLSCEVAGRTLFDDQSFSVEAGHILVIRGPSGVGKSRLLRAISCLDPLKEGSLSLDGQSAQRLGLTNWRARVIYIPQSRVALQGSLREYFLTLLNLAAQKRTLALAGQQDTKGLIEKLEVLIRRVGLVSDTHAQELSFLERKWDSLSGGESNIPTYSMSISRFGNTLRY